MRVFGAERCRTLGHLPAVADLLHQISDRQILLNVVRRVAFTPVIDGVGVFGDDPIREGDVRGDHQVAGHAQRHDSDSRSRKYVTKICCIYTTITIT